MSTNLLNDARERLTTQQFVVYKFCVEYVDKNKRFPSQAILREKFDWKSDNTVQWYLRLLVTKGFVIRKSRGNYVLTTQCPHCGKPW